MREIVSKSGRKPFVSFDIRHTAMDPSPLQQAAIIVRKQANKQTNNQFNERINNQIGE